MIDTLQERRAVLSEEETDETLDKEEAERRQRTLDLSSSDARPSADQAIESYEDSARGRPGTE